MNSKFLFPNYIGIIAFVSFLCYLYCDSLLEDELDGEFLRNFS